MVDGASSADILHLSDMDRGVPAEVAEIDGSRFDAIVSTGDLGSGPQIDQSLERLASVGSPDNPVYMIPGNTGPQSEWVGTDIEDRLSQYESIANGRWTVLDDLEGFEIALGGWFFGPAREGFYGDLIHEPGSDTVSECQEVCQTCEEYENWRELSQRLESPDVAFHHGVPYMGDEETDVDVLANRGKVPEALMGEHNGSVAYREFIEQFEPALAVGGHIHEGEGSYRLDETLVINGGLNRTGQIHLEEDDAGEVRTNMFYSSH